MTQKEAYNTMMQELNSQSSLTGLHRAQDTAELFLQELSTGKVGIERVLAWTFAFVVSLVSSLWGQSKLELQELADKSEPITDAWMAEKARQFRWKYDPFQLNGYEIIVGEDNIPTWSEEALADDAALIVSFSSAETNGGVCLVKANGSSGGLPVVLPTVQKDALAAFMERVQPPGSQVSTISRLPDWLSIFTKIYYNPIHAVDLEGVTIQDAVNTAIVEFLQNLPFNGVISRNRLEDAIREVSGVVDCVLTQTKGRKSFEAFGSPQAVVFVRQYKTFAGSCVYDQANSNIEFFLA